jgi:UDP-glucose 4-epimerase
VRLLITGGAGYIGSHLLTELLPFGHEICVVDDFSNGKEESLKRVKSLSKRAFESHNLDLCDGLSLAALFNEFKPEAVIHLAGLKSVNESVHFPVHYYERNICGTVQLLRAMDSYECNVLIFSSSATVYAPQESRIDELQLVKPNSPYGRSKYFIEEIIGDWTKMNQRKSAVVLRYFNPVGAHKSGEIGEDPIDIPNNLMPLIAQVAGQRRKRLDIFGDDYDTKDGTAIRDFIHVMDLAKGHIEGLVFAMEHSGLETFNLGTGVGHSVLEVIKTFEIVNGIDIPICVKPRRVGDVSKSVANVDKARKILGWKTELSIREICEDVWRWQSKNPLGYNT